MGADATTQASRIVPISIPRRYRFPMALDFRILGPLEVAEDGVVLRLGGRMQRAVLAILLLHAGRVVPVEQLVDRLYGDKAPRTGVGQIRDHVSQLRKAFDTESTILETQAPGYVLRLDPSQLDATRFELGVEEGAAALRAGRAEEAHRLFRDALELWRGPALADFAAEEFAQPAAGRLEELRIAATEQRIAAELAAGGDGSLVPELLVLVGEHPLREQLRAQLMLALYRGGRQAEATEAFHEARRILVEDLGIDPSPELRELHARILRQDPSLAPQATPTPAVQTVVRNPYKGLRPFLEVDSADFFGRETLTTRLVQLINQKRFVALVGPSGSGKSSVVRAGALPLLRGHGMHIVEVTPGAYPLEELEAALLRVAANPPVSLLEQLASDERGLLRAVKRILPADTSELVLVIDQLEELFTLVDDENVRRLFLAGIECVVRDPRSRVRVVATLRADFYDRPLLHRGFAELVRDGAEVVLPLSPEELERAVAAPARHVGLQLEEGLLAQIVTDVVDEPGALPLLQYALTELVERRDAQMLTRAEYHALGGISGAVAGRAEALYDGLTASGKTAARQLFLRLVTIGPDVPTRRRVAHSELETLAVDQHELGLVIDAFGGSRLLSFDRDPRTEEATVELAHEALLAEWERLRVWVDTARDDVRMHRRLASAASEWVDAGRDESFLLRGGRLSRFESWSASSSLARTALEDEFLGASVAERAAQEKAEHDRLARERALERRSMLRLRALAGVLAAAAAVAAGLTVFAFHESSRSRHEARIATARQLAAASVAHLADDPELSILLALRAVETTRGPHRTAAPEAVDALHRAIAASRIVRTFPHAGSKAVAYSPDGSQLATAGRLGVAIWDVATGRRLLSIHAGMSGFHAVAFSPDGSSLAARTDDGSVLTWNARTGRQRLRLRETDGVGFKSFGGVAFSPDGRDLAADDANGGVEIWDLRTARVVRRLKSSAILCGIAWSPTGTQIGAGDCGTFYLPARARIWDVATGRLAGATRPETGAIIALAFNPTGRRIATANLGGSASVSDVRTGSRRLLLRGHTGEVVTIAYSRVGKLIATGGTDGTARVWDAIRGSALLTLQGGPAPVDAVAFSPDGKRLATASADGSVRVWNITPAGSRDWLTIAAHRGGVESLAYADGDTRLSTTGLLDRRNKIWDARTGALVTSSRAIVIPGFVYGGLIAENRTFTSIGATSPTGATVGVTFEGEATLFDAGGRPTMRLAPHHGGVQSVAFDPSGRRAAVGSRDGSVVVYDVAAHRAVRTLATGQGVVEAVALSPDGRTLATGGQDTTVKLWDVATGGQVSTLTGHTNTITAIAFNGSDTRIATGSLDGTVRVYILPLDQLVAVARRRLTESWTRAECMRYLNGDCPRAP
jgi:WD40 repeat protein/DNA-binding SARP family transcriptional activator/energy-coupling factor transporter ATP-binding protein EcfA2